MQTPLLASLLAIVFALTPSARAANSVEVTAQRKKEEVSKSAGKRAGDEAKKKENATCTITVKNVTMADLPALSVDYILFVDRQKLGEKRTAKPLVQRKTGTLKIDALPRSGSQVLTTEPVELVSESLTGAYHFPDGGRIKAEDSIAGIWVRVSQDGKVVGEYANPSNITSKGWEDKLKAGDSQ